MTTFDTSTITYQDRIQGYRQEVSQAEINYANSFLEKGYRPRELEIEKSVDIGTRKGYMFVHYHQVLKTAKNPVHRDYAEAMLNQINSKP